MPKAGFRQHMQTDSAKKYFPISPLVLRPDFRGPFNLFLRHGDNYVLFNAQGRLLSRAKREELAALNIAVIYIAESDLKRYNAYLRDNLIEVLNDESIPL